MLDDAYSWPVTCAVCNNAFPSGNRHAEASNQPHLPPVSHGPDVPQIHLCKRAQKRQGQVNPVARTTVLTEKKA